MTILVVGGSYLCDVLATGETVDLSEMLLMDSAVSTADESSSSPYDVARSFLMGFGVDSDSIDSSESDSNRDGSRVFSL